MQGFSKGSKGPYITVHYNGYIEASMQGYSRGTEEPSLTVHYNG
jgi:hypothetical protein